VDFYGLKWTEFSAAGGQNEVDPEAA